ncbi:MAG: IS4 family transposase [Acidobacteriota bacterium]
MSDTQIFDYQWPYLLKMLPKHLDLEASAKDFGALTRKRGLTSAEDLLRLALVYGFCGFSLRQTAAWAQATGIAKLSDVAVLKRLKKAAPWLGYLLGSVLAQRAETKFGQTSGLRLRLVDATTVSKPGSKGADWRVHLGFDLNSLSIDEVQVTDFRGGETFKRFSVKAQEILIADRGYAHRPGIVAVQKAGGGFVIRFSWNNMPLLDPDGQALDLIALLREIPDTEILDVPVLLAADTKKSLPEQSLRLVALRKSEAAAEQERRRILRDRSKKQKRVDPQTLEAAGYTFILTSVGREIMNAQQILEIYRFRWQVELAFKRLKSLLQLNALLAKDQALAQTFLYSKLLAALLLEDLLQRFLDFSPWGYQP